MKRKKIAATIKGLVIRAGLLLFMGCFFLIGASVGSRENPEPEPAVEAAVIIAVPPPVAAPPPTPEPTPEYFAITMLGDCTLASNHYNKSHANAYENIVGDDYAYPFAKTVHLFNDDDFTIANLECALTEHTALVTKPFSFKGPPEYVNILAEGSVEFVTLGNNHVLDYGEQGYQDTKSALAEKGIGYAGRDEWIIHTTDRGLKIGVYALSFGETKSIQAGIAALKEAGAEFIIAALHWGTEGFYEVNKTQRNQGRAAIDAGAHVVMGTHPHTLQEVEEYNGKYIYYCIGNWSFGGNTNPRDKDTVVVRLTVIRDVDGTVRVSDREHIPCASSGEENGNNYQPVPYERGSEGYERTLSKLEGSFDGPNLTVDYSYAAE